MLIYLPPQHNASRKYAPDVSKNASCVGYVHLWVRGVWDGDEKKLLYNVDKELGPFPGCVYLEIEKFRYIDDDKEIQGYTWAVCPSCYRNYCFIKVWQELKAMS